MPDQFEQASTRPVPLPLCHAKRANCSWSRSSKFRNESGNRACIITARRMISGLIVKYRMGSALSWQDACLAPAPKPVSFDRADQICCDSSHIRGWWQVLYSRLLRFTSSRPHSLAISDFFCMKIRQRSEGRKSKTVACGVRAPPPASPPSRPRDVRP